MTCRASNTQIRIPKSCAVCMWDEYIRCDEVRVTDASYCKSVGTRTHVPWEHGILAYSSSGHGRGRTLRVLCSR